MFDAGFQEFFLIFVIGLLVLGPKRLPRVAHAAGLWLGKAKLAMNRLQREIQREMMIEETREAVELARKASEQRVLEEQQSSTPEDNHQSNPSETRQPPSSAGGEDDRG